MSQKKEFGCAYNCRLATKFAIPNPDMRVYSEFTISCKNRRVKGVFSRMFGLMRNNVVHGKKVLLAISRDENNPEKDPKLICADVECVNAVPI